MGYNVAMSTIDITHAGEILGVTRKTVYNMQRRGDLPNPITKRAILEYLEAQQDGLREIEGRLGAYMQQQATKEQISLFD